ncbi:hypothetical protein NYE48_19205 [Paenibacillus sp. FSL M7-1455]|uniref:hypothetical protein n=1 Tax=Paenibacillus sp. FSL M7-1455 TaxID=2975316 RepID=UPI0030F5E912
MWILENFYWILIILFAVVSALSKSGKSKQKQNPRGMPTFGGGNGRDRRDARKEPRGFSGSPDAAGTREAADSRGTAAGDANLSRRRHAEASGPDDDTGEGVSEMWQDGRPETLEDSNAAMQMHLDRVNASLDRIEQTEPAPSLDRQAEQPRLVSRLAKEARNGVVWAEILGPPRSKRPYGGPK